MGEREGVDMEREREERLAAKNQSDKPKKELTEDECWKHLYFIKKYKSTKKDDGLRAVYINTLTGRYRLKKKIKEKKDDLKGYTQTFFEWDWDGEAYSV